MRRIAGFLLLLGLIYLGWQYYWKGILIDESKLSGEIESAVNDVLSRHGVQDSYVLKTRRMEQKENWPVPTSWIKTEREIFLPGEIAVSSISKDIKQTATRFKINFSTVSSSASPPLHDKAEQDSRRFVVELRKKNRVFQRLIFLTGDIKSLSFLGREAGSKKFQVAIVIDDVAGRPSDLESLEKFFSLGIPITYAVLPMEKLSRRTAEKIWQSGNEVIVHQPMEPEDLSHNNPGKAALMVRMRPREIKQKILANFKNVPYAVGVSNHMGSRFTADLRGMNTLFLFLKKQKAKSNQSPVFFFDSYTSSKTVGGKVAEKVDLKYLRNDLFLDLVDDVPHILKQTEVLMIEAKKKGTATAIAHIQRKFMVEALQQAIPKFKKEGIEFVHLSQLIANDANKNR